MESTKKVGKGWLSRDYFDPKQSPSLVDNIEKDELD